MRAWMWTGVILGLLAALQPISGQETGSTGAPSTPSSSEQNNTGSALVGVKQNSSNDFGSFLSALYVNGAMLVGTLAAFSVLRLHFPRVFSDRVSEAAVKPAPGVFGWISSSLQTTPREAVVTAGLDGAMMVEFCGLGARIFGQLVPLAVVLGVLNCAFGGGAAGDQKLSMIGMANVEMKHKWLYYIHAVAVWIVCLVVQRNVFQAQRNFLSLRFEWLRKLPTPQSTTILVESIPVDFRSDAKLREFFASAFTPEQVLDARVVKHTEKLAGLIAKRNALEDQKKVAEAKAEKGGGRPQVRQGCCGKKVDLVSSKAEEIEGLNAAIAAERAGIVEAANQVGGVNGPSGFVTFVHRRDAELVKGIKISADRNLWQIMGAPDHSDVRWKDLLFGRKSRIAGWVIGHCALLGLFWAFLPFCVGVNGLAAAQNMGPFQSIWSGIAPTLGLKIFLALLPIVMLMIFDRCFVLRSDAWSQQKLQNWYFWFQVVYVLLITCISQSIATQLQKLIKEPTGIVDMLVDNLPGSSDFYLNFVLLAWAALGMEALRIAVLAKYLLFKPLYEEGEAKAKADPGNQGYGMRSASLVIALLIGLVFSMINPLIVVLLFIQMCLQRVVYGYLLVYAEPREADLGGAFWVTQLEHLQQGMLFFCFLMFGLLAHRAEGWLPSAIAAGTIPFMVLSYLLFKSSFDWETLPFCEVVHLRDGTDVPLPAGELVDVDVEGQSARTGATEVAATYIQPELIAEEACC